MVCSRTFDWPDGARTFAVGEQVLWDFFLSKAYLRRLCAVKNPFLYLRLEEANLEPPVCIGDIHRRNDCRYLFI